MLGPAGSGVAAAVARAAQSAEPDLASFYGAHRGRPIWTDGKALKPEAIELVAIVAGAAEDGLDPAHYDLPQLKAAVAAARGGNAEALARAELLLSRAFVAYTSDLHRPPPADRPFLVDAELAAGPPDPRRLLEGAAAAPWLHSYLQSARRMNPVYESLRAALAAHGNDDPKRALLRLNLDRARALPADPGRRFILVDAAGARLQLFENGRAIDEMKVIVGKPDMQTPILSGLIRFAVLNPYWNIPPDLVRDKIAPRILAGDRDYLKRQRLEILSDWSDGAATLDPEEVDWQAVASGALPLRVRQRPGRDNMMGAVKFMLPNRLGIYLHDTPDKALFAAADRRRSSGCVRVEDAGRLERWLFGGATPLPSTEAEHRVDLPAPVPVYITYLTAAPTANGGIAFQPDRYGRDKVRLARS